MKGLNNDRFLLLRKLLWLVPHGLKKKLGLDLNFERVMQKTFPPSEPFCFVQIGGFDGKSFDTLYDFVKARKSIGIILEPLHDYYEQLRGNYAFNNNILLMNKAVHPTQKEVTLYRVRADAKDELPDWTAGITSLDKNHYKKSGIDEQYIVAETCAADHLMAIIESFVSDKQVHFFQCDVEGFDLETIRMIDFAIFKPYVIKFEYMNLTKRDVEEAMRLLRSQSYFCFYQFPDVIGVQLSFVQL